MEDLDQGQVHVEGLQAHPGEGGQHEVVEHGRRGDAQAVVGEWREPGVQQEHHAQAQQGEWQVDEDLGWVLSPHLPVREETGKFCSPYFIILRFLFFSVLDCTQLY